MHTMRRRRRRAGSLGALKARLWATIEYNVSVIEDESLDHDLRQRASVALVQASLAYAKVIEEGDLAKEMKQLEALAQGNGHGS